MPVYKLSENLFFRAYIRAMSAHEEIAAAWQTVHAGMRMIFQEMGSELPAAGELSLVVGHARNDSPRSEKRVELGCVQDYILKHHLTGFSVIFGEDRNQLKNFQITLRRNGPNYHVLNVQFEKSRRAPKTWRPLIEATLRTGRGLFASQFNTAYRAWQNMFLPENYALFVGEVPAGFRYKDPDPGSLFPETPHIITSLNPGRSIDVHASGRPQNVDAEMWIGPDFWEHAAHTKDQVLSADFFLEVADTPDFLYLKSWPHAFTRPDREQGRIQQKLWRLLFGEDCEWPPGSGDVHE